MKIITAGWIRGAASAGSNYFFRGSLQMPYFWFTSQCRVDDFNNGDTI
jgi:hypothetical protein